MSYHLWPIVMQNEECSVPDVILYGVWKQIVDEGKAGQLFYGGTVKCAADFLTFLKDPMNLPVLVVDEEAKKIVFLAWLNGLQDGHAYGHFCSLGPFKRGAVNAFLDYWRSWNMFRLIIGLTPETNDLALRAIRMAGFKTLGILPRLCMMAHENNALVGGVISYIEF